MLRSRTPVAVHAAVAWSLFFAALHAYWAVGGTGGLEGERVTGALLLIDIVAIPLCLLAAALARAAVDPARWPAPGWTVAAGAWTAAVLLGLRGLTGMVQTALGGADDVPWGVAAADPFFLLGGVFFAAVARLTRHGVPAARAAKMQGLLPKSE